MTINFKDDDLKRLPYEGDNKLIKEKSYTQNTTKNDIIDFIKPNLQYENDYGGEDVISRIAKNISIIFIKDWNTDQNKAFIQKKEALRRFYEIVPETIWKNKLRLINIYKDQNKKIIDNDTVDEAYSELNSHGVKDDAYKYYEYIQFKRCIFKCTEMKYDNNTGRVSNITFEFVKLR